MRSNRERLLECLNCKYADICEKTISDPTDNPDGTCKTKQDFIKNDTSLITIHNCDIL